MCLIFVLISACQAADFALGACMVTLMGSFEFLTCCVKQTLAKRNTDESSSLSSSSLRLSTEMLAVSRSCTSSTPLKCKKTTVKLSFNESLNVQLS